AHEGQPVPARRQGGVTGEGAAPAMFTAAAFFAARARRQGTKKDAKKNAHHHNVYVIELDPAVLKDRAFRAANPEHDPAKPCFYVGCTGLSPYERFLNHKDGHKANRYARKYGL